MKKRIIEIATYVFLIGLVVGFLFVHRNQTRDKNKEENSEIYCDFEEQDENGNFITDNPDYKFLPSNITDTTSFSGKKSLLIPSWKVYQNLIIIPGVKGQKYITINFKMRKESDASVVVQAKIDKNFYKISDNKSEDIENGWMNITLKFSTTEDFNDTLQIYFYNKNNKNAFFDDISIKISNRSYYPNYKEKEPLLLYIEESEMKKLEKIRTRALEQGILQTEDDSYVEALIYGDNKMMHAQVRLKGDWLDHLLGSKWSFRIKLEDDSWHGMRVFSIQTPLARGFNNEWLYHKMCKDQDILTTRYDYVPVYLNGQSLGMYSYEEHFQKELIESSMRREGPIIKFSETDFWDFILNNVPGEFSYESSVIEPFSEKKVFSDSTQYNYFILAANLLNMFREMEAPASEIFDVEKVAKFIALANAENAFHSLQWHNMRFYYNPVLCRLEPIAFDNYSGPTEFTQDNPITPMLKLNINDKRNNSFYFLTTDSVFTDKYLKYLGYYTDMADYRFFKNKFFEEYVSNENLLKQEFSPYRLDTIQFITIKNKVCRFLPEFIDSLKNTGYMARVRSLTNVPLNTSNIYSENIFADKYVKIYKNKPEVFLVKIFLSTGIQIEGAGSDKEITKNLDILIEKPDNKAVLSKEISIPGIPDDATHLYFSLPKTDSVFKVEIIRWPAPTTYNPRTDMAKNSADISKYTDIGSKKITFTGNMTFKKSIYIPSGFTVVFEPGTNLNLTQKAAFVSCSTVEINGTKEKPVKIYSSDKTGMGFTVLQAPGKCRVENAVFDNLNTIDYKGWHLTGAVTFYECKVDIFNTSFTNNHCEDMLNTVRCLFLVKDCLIKNTFGDSHDSDFCTGTVDNCMFINNGNDGIDFSTSEVKILNCTINGAGDKAVSLGEHTHAIISNIVIDNVVIGIAAKDLSDAKVDNCKISNAKYGFVLLQKKPEFGPATVTATNVTFNQVIEETLIERNSVLVLNGKTINGNKAKLFSIFYQ